MKRILLVAASAFTLCVQAQTKEGKVVYERTIQMQMRSLGNIPEEILKQMPKARTDQFQLMFTPQHSYWEFLPSAANEEGNNTFSSGGVVISMRGTNPNEVSYVDFAKGSRTDQREVMERSFIVSDTIEKLKWKLSDETKTILNFTAKKATASRTVASSRISMENGEMKRETVTDTVPVVAWYTTDIPVPAGPDLQGQLPGLILELDVNNGRQVTKAIEFSPKVAANKIKEPKDGKKVTAAEFITERDKLMEEMRKNRGGGRDFIRMQ
jgi:GLPGLI family protein